MPKEKALELLQSLQTEIDQTSSLTANDKDKFDKLLLEVERSLADEKSTDDVSESLSKTISEFEASHPRLTSIVNEIMITLSNMGI